MLMNAKWNGPDASQGELRENFQDRLNSMCLAASLRHIFRAIVCGTLKSLSKQPGYSVTSIMEAIDTRVGAFFVSSLQRDVLTMKLEHDGESPNGLR